MKRYIKKLLRENFSEVSSGYSIDESFLSSMIGKRVDKFRESWVKFLNIAKRESNETYEAVLILGRLLNPRTKGGVSEGEILFLKAQSKDILKIAAVAGLGVISVAIPLALEKILNKYNKSIMPGENKIDDKVK